jgi:hypothetical protein
VPEEEPAAREMRDQFFQRAMAQGIAAGGDLAPKIGLRFAQNQRHGRGKLLDERDPVFDRPVFAWRTAAGMNRDPGAVARDRVAP